MTRPRRPPLIRADPEGYELEADLLRVMANPKRLMIISALEGGGQTVTEIAAQLGLSLQNTSQHLRLMRDRRLVRAHREGREVRYELTSPIFPRCCKLVRQTLVEQAGTREVDLRRGRTLSDAMTGSPGLGPLGGRAGARAQG